MDWPLDAPFAERLLNEAQRGFPLVERPFAALAEQLGTDETTVIASCRHLSARGAISRVGGVWAPGVGGAALLCAMAVPAERLDSVAAQVSAHPGVNHNYEREHALNLWFVLTGNHRAQLETVLHRLETDTGLPVVRLGMVRPYRIDLGFDLHRPPGAGSALRQRPPRVTEADRPLAALVEAGLPLNARPFARWAQSLDDTTAGLLARIQGWLDAGTLRRFGLVVRHHEVGFGANAMTVFDLPDTLVDAAGERLAAQPGVTLCYRRERASAWPYNLYCMVHGRSRPETLSTLQRAIDGADLDGWPRQVLFSRRRFKQTGAHYFRALPEEVAHGH